MTTAINQTSAASLYENINAANKGSDINTGKSSTKSKAEETQDRFLKLLMTQLQNQDPMNPMDSAQSTTQLAQIQMVTGIDELNTSIASMATSYQAGLSVQAAGLASSLIGHEVLAPGSKFSFDGTNAREARVAIPDKTGPVTVAIYNANGVKVDEIALGKPKAGLSEVKWDGTDAQGNKLPAGTYKMVATSTDEKGNAKELTAYVPAKVESIDLSGGSLKLTVTGNGSMSLNDVIRIS
ncbi:flagellar hook assembly protein FlgD [Chitinimonas taiwanensis]|uniref:Basal-body rod modification protein FlgD n=1 Tax=Chitinimonas taiwanensis DSM 18899 TaxID=1121279 RepID=A0A1K2HM70_9NEIS|nr:flagellar hook assembly protein FlgD [Chitinimonas taiwanensis]SFZ77920.1 flagellar basal-body rod modification protein FlgD [Chitinimonas taiwanensis DSM 18899]